MSLINNHVLVSGVDFFDDTAAINPFMDESVAINRLAAADEHAAITKALESAGVTITKVHSPADCQDGVYTANWALVRGDTAVLSSLPNARKGEESYAKRVLQSLNKNVLHVPDGLKFSGQGDALPCGNFLFAGCGYRSDPEAQEFAAHALGYELIQLQTIPQLDNNNLPVINRASGWADSFFYDLDLALSVLRAPSADGKQKGLIAWCPEAFTLNSQERLRHFEGVEKIEVSLNEAKNAFACNLVSTGKTIVMSAHAPEFIAKLKTFGFEIITPEITELSKGGGYIRCITLTLNNA